MPLFGASHEKVEKWIADRNVKKLLDALKSDDATLRRSATEGLGRIRGPEVIAYCKNNAHHQDQNVRWNVTQILGLIGTPEAMKILAEVRDPTDEMVRKAENAKRERAGGKK
jgi:HEAT repeat protein